MSEILFVQAILIRASRRQCSSFNLLSEILFVQASMPLSISSTFGCFNLLSEILFVQAHNAVDLVSDTVQFQSLERDSVCSSICAITGGRYYVDVSIS